MAVYPPLPHQMTIEWNVSTLTISSEGLETPQCRECQTALNVHQPDEDRPEQLLATCARCGTWYLIELGKRKTEAFMFDLPNVTLIHASMVSAKTKVGRKSPSKPPAE